MADVNPASIQWLFAYHYGMFERLWDCIAELGDSEFVQEVEYSIGSIRNHMVHMLSVDQRWIARIRGLPLPDFEPQDYETISAVRDEWEKAESAVMAYVKDLTVAELRRVAEFQFARTQKAPVWQALIHVVNHGTDHRSQVLRLLHDFGAPTLEQDLLDYHWTN